MAGCAARIGAGALPAWWVLTALGAPEVPRLAGVTAAAIGALTVWRPGLGLLAVVFLSPAGGLLAPAPARGSELLACAFLAAWLLRIWTPLAPGGWPRTATTAAGLYLCTILASWLALSIAGAAGVSPLALPQFLLWLVPPDHLILSSPEPETRTLLQNMQGLGLFFAAAALVRQDATLLTRMVSVVVVSSVAMSVATVADVARQWADVEYAGWFLRRFAIGERFSLHLSDHNAAASLYALAATSAGVLAAFDRRRRWLWTAAVVVMVPSMMLAGSVSANIGILIAGVAVLIVSSRSAPWTRASVGFAAAAGVILAVAVTAAVTGTWRTEGRATASEALAQRGGFLTTSTRMFASEPVFGVGIGRYFDRSAEFMPEALREFYGNENAHNYFAQQFAELGVTGGVLFLCLTAAAIGLGWRAAATHAATNASLVALTAGASAYLLTCLTGHPLLVPAVALPFWAMLGALSAWSRSERESRLAPILRRAAAVCVVLLALATIARSALSLTGVSAPPRELGFHAEEADRNGTPFRWMTRHAVAYIPAGPGVVTLRLHHPDEPSPQRPLAIEVAIEGRPVATREVPADEWTTVEIGVRDTGHAPFRRIDLRANHEWTQQVRLGQRPVTRPISAMVAAIRWTSLDSVR